MIAKGLIRIGQPAFHAIATAAATLMVKKLRLLKGGSVPTFLVLGRLHNKLAVDA